MGDMTYASWKTWLFISNDNARYISFWTMPQRFAILWKSAGDVAIGFSEGWRGKHVGGC